MSKATEAEVKASLKAKAIEDDVDIFEFDDTVKVKNQKWRRGVYGNRKGKTVDVSNHGKIELLPGSIELE